MSMKALAEDLHKLNEELDERDKIKALEELKSKTDPAEFGLILLGLILGDKL